MSVLTTKSVEPKRASRRALLVALLVAGAWACGDATEVQLLEVEGFGGLFGVAFLDMDGSGTASAGDEPLSGADVVLSSSASAEVVRRTRTDSAGVFTFLEIPLGSYVVNLDSEVLGDSLETVGTIGTIVVELGDTTRTDLGATYPTVTMQEALALGTGARVFTSGIALNTRLNFGDGQVHFAGGSAFLRALNVDRSGVSRGDSVRLLGRIILDNGRPALDEVTPTILVPGAALVLPEETTTAGANSADGGQLDAGLVRIGAAEFGDTATVAGGHFRFWANDGSGSVEVWIRSFLGLDHTDFRPDTILRVDEIVGLLSPYDDGGTVRWRVMPRNSADIQLEVKNADIAVTATLDTAQASFGDTVQVTVVARNNGPLVANGVEIRDTIPTAMSFVGATQTDGVYNPGTGIWTLGNMASGDADTLRLRMSVADSLAGTVTNVSESLGLTFEVDPVGSNNLVFLVITIS